LAVPDNGTTTLLSHKINLNLNSNELIPISGISGCGKSTLLRTVSGLSPIQDGTIRIFGKLLHDYHIPSLRKKCVYLHQHPVMFPGSVEFNILAPFSFKTMKQSTPDHSNLVELLESVGLQKKILSSDAGSISGGEAQRVALVRGMLINPSILLLDEPTASLDADSSECVIAFLLKWVKDAGRGILWVVHERDVIEKLAIRPLHLTPDGLEE